VSGATTGRGSAPSDPPAGDPPEIASADLPPYEGLAPAPVERRKVNLLAVGVALAFFLGAASIVGFVVYETVRKHLARATARAELSRILASQPDFRAVGEGSAGSAFIRGPMYQKGDRLYLTLRLPRSEVLAGRSEVGLVNVGLIVATHRSPTIVIPEVRGFGPLPARGAGKPFLTLREEFATILDFEEIEVDVIGDETVNGYRARIYKVVDANNRANYMYVSVAPALRDLVVKCAIRWRDATLAEDLSFSLRDVSFDVDDASLEVPRHYTRIGAR
jgi:hypothetical protein